MTIASAAGSSKEQQPPVLAKGSSSSNETVIVAIERKTVHQEEPHLAAVAAAASTDQKKPGKLKSLLQLAAQLNPFSHPEPAAAAQRRRSSLDGVQQGGLLGLARRYLSGGRGEEEKPSSKSAPTTPIKAPPEGAVRPNGLQRQQKTRATTVRFVEQEQQREKEEPRPCQRADRAVQTGELGAVDDPVSELFQESGDTDETPMSLAKFRHHGYRLIDYICNYLDTIGERRVTPLNIEPGYLKALIAADAPLTGESFATIMQDFEKHIMCGITHWQHPHFHAYFPAGNAFPSILADMLSDALGCVGFSWAASPAYTELEIIMLDWMGKMIGLPDEFLCLSGADSKGGGVIQGSASECVLVALLAARHWALDRLRLKYPHLTDGQLLDKLIGYCSKEAHSCVEKAAMIGFIRMRALETDHQRALTGATLRQAMEADLAQGLEPFIVVATLGTTSCASFDRLEELGQVCHELGDVWLHVDAAYAGSALICPEFKYLIQGIHLATSFNTNPNKWMLINFDCSLMWVRDRFKLTRTFVVDPLYLQHSFSDQAIDYRHWGVPLSRRFRALKLWFVIRNYGVEGLRAYIRNHVRLAKLFERHISEDPRFTINNQVVLGLVCFRLKGSNALNQRLLSRINASGQLHMVPASLEGRFVIRFCVCDQNAKDEDINYAYRCISQQATELLDSIEAGRERIRAISQQNTIDLASLSQQSVSNDDKLFSPPGSPGGQRQQVHRWTAAEEEEEGEEEEEDEQEQVLLESLGSLEHDQLDELEERGQLDSRSSDEWRSARLQASSANAGSSSTTGRAELADEANDELKTMTQRRNNMSLRYKREFFVRVVSDPRVYRASISGDINGSHASLAGSSSKTGQQQQASSSAKTGQQQASSSVQQRPAQAQ